MKKILSMTLLIFFSTAAYADQSEHELNTTGSCPRCSLSEKKMENANLSGADLSRSMLRKVNLRGADLSRANLSGSDLSGANLTRANLSHADLFGANLTKARIKGANFTGARLAGAIWTDGLPCSLSAAPGVCR